MSAIGKQQYNVVNKVNLHEEKQSTNSIQLVLDDFQDTYHLVEPNRFFSAVNYATHPYTKKPFIFLNRYYKNARTRAPPLLRSLFL
jgi:hypothetical protein